MSILIIISIGIVIGLVLGLTGAGGSIFALPLLVLLLGISSHEAVTIALCAVAASAIFGSITRLRSGEIEWLPAIVFILVGSVFTPLGSWLNQQIDELYILVGFTLIVIYVASKMWRQASINPSNARVTRAQLPEKTSDQEEAYCLANNKKAFGFGLRCFIGILGGASLTGVLSGLFGVGGGFIIVPTLMFLTGISIKHAVATSLIIISVLSTVAFSSYWVQGAVADTHLLIQISVGGVIGMALGILAGKKISGPQLQKLFAVAMFLLSSVMITKHLNLF